MKIRRRFNKTTPVHELTEELTSVDKLFVVYHLGIPEIQRDSWSLSLRGMVERPMEFSLGDIASLPKSRVCAFHECAGSAVNPKVPVRRVARVEWGGIRLRDVLQAAGIAPGAAYVWASGADSGVYDGTGVEVDEYQKDIPLAKALEDEVLLATEVNGESLSEELGGPLRLVVPGYYGTCSVKWLRRLDVMERRSDAYFSKTLYTERTVKDGIESETPVWEVQPHAVMVAPAAHDKIACASQTIWGRAWGANEIATVEVSTDGGSTWGQARLERRHGRDWQRFSIDWHPPAPGSYRLVCRATDGKGIAQPASGARNEVFGVSVEVI